MFPSIAAQRANAFIHPLWRHRLAPMLLLGCLFLLTALCTRGFLLLISAKEVDWTVNSLGQIFLIGLGFDLAALSYWLIPFFLYLLLVPDRLYKRTGHNWALLIGFSAWVFLLLFTACSEYFFWDEFSSRFNFIAVDYLIYTNEVIGNIVESYPVYPILAVLALIALAITWGLRSRLLAAQYTPWSWKQRAWYLVLIAVPFITFYGVDDSYKDRSDNRYVNSLAGNGVYEFFAAAYNNELNYQNFYYSLETAEAFKRLRTLLPTPHAQLLTPDPQDIRRKVVYARPEHKLNVVLITVESLSAEFFQHFGSNKNITPRLDALMDQSLLFTNLYATGTRTVRGLEALSLSLPPTPGQSIVKRPNNEDLFTLGAIFRSKGYATRYIYGGYGYFDNMNYFFGHNGYQVVDRTDIDNSKIHHETIWGVADEDLFTLALEQIDQSYTKGELSFNMVMTTSNHRPYTYPDGRIDIPSPGKRPGAVKYTDYAIGDFIERARSKPWFDNTLFVVVADHCASSAGKTDLPVNRYHIPMLVYAPKHIQPGVMPRLMSQIDVAPTLLGLLNFSYTSLFLGYDMFDLEPGRERAFISTYQDLGMVQDQRLVRLTPRKQALVNQVNFADGSTQPSAADPELIANAVAWYQGASLLFSNGHYHWADATNPSHHTPVVQRD